MGMRTVIPRSSGFAVVMLAVLAACGGGDSAGPPPPPPLSGPVVSSVEVTPAAVSVFIGDTLRLTGTARDQHGAVVTGKPVTWSSSDVARATVSDGLVTGVSEGTLSITATIEGKVGSSTVQVLVPAIAGQGDTPAAASITRVRFVPRAEDYTATHPELPGAFVSFNTLMLSFADGVTTRQANALLEGIHATVVGSIPGAPGGAPGILFLRVPAQSHSEMTQLLAVLQADPRVAKAAPDALLGSDRITRDNNGTADAWTWQLTATGNNWGLELSRVPQMWNLNPAIEKERSRTGVQPPVTSILDAGFADSHTDLEYENLSPGNPFDHGTHVAGIIGAKFDNAFGIDGINPFARMKVRGMNFFSPGGGAINTRTSAGQAILSALDSLLVAHPDIRVLNLSMGYTWSSVGIDTDTKAAARQLASDHGTFFVSMLRGLVNSGRNLPVIVVSSGNDSQSGLQQARYNSPMAAAALIHGAAAVIVVEAIQLSSGSAGGATRQPFSNVNGHLSAPGHEILSTMLNNSFGMFSGTSMSAPYVAGLIGYLYTLVPTFPLPTLAENKMRDLLVANAVAVAGGARPRIDAFGASLDIDRVIGGDAVLRKLLDVDDGSSDGNRRDLPVEDVDVDLGTGDGRIDMSDFRRWRDWLLQVENPAGLDLDGPAGSLKRDVNADGRVGTAAEENIYPRGDFNGDGIISRTAVQRVPGVMGGQEVTDLQVLQQLFADQGGGYLASELPGLLNSVDIRIQAQACLSLPGVVRVQSAIRATGQDTSAQVRLHDADPEQIYTAPFRAGGWTASAKAIDVTGAVIGESEQSFALSLGGDASWTPTCPPPPCPAVGNLLNVCEPPPPPPPPPQNCDSYRIDSDARFAAASGVTCASSMSIGGFNNSLTVLVSFPQLTQVVETFVVRAEVPGGLSLPVLSSVGVGPGGCGALFEMAKLAVLDLPALAKALVCGILVRNAPDLTTLKLGALALVEGELGITGNPKLSDISGIACGARVNGNLIITNNPQLSTAAAQALANCLNVTGTVTIQGNKIP